MVLVQYFEGSVGDAEVRKVIFTEGIWQKSGKVANFYGYANVDVVSVFVPITTVE